MNRNTIVPASHSFSNSFSSKSISSRKAILSTFDMNKQSNYPIRGDQAETSISISQFKSPNHKKLKKQVGKAPKTNREDIENTITEEALVHCRRQVIVPMSRNSKLNQSLGYIGQRNTKYMSHAS